MCGKRIVCLQIVNIQCQKNTLYPIELLPYICIPLLCVFFGFVDDITENKMYNINTIMSTQNYTVVYYAISRRSENVRAVS